MMMTTTTETTTTTMSTSSAFTSRSVSLNSMLDLHQSFAVSKDKSLSSQELLSESQENITIQAEVYSSPRKSLRTAQSAISTSNLPQRISACSTASNDPDAIEIVPEPLVARPRSQQDAVVAADTRNSDTPELVFGNRDSSLTDFLYPNPEFVDAFPTVSIQPIPVSGALILDVMNRIPGSNIFCVISNLKKCVGCKKKMTVYFSYQKDAKSYIYDLKKNVIVQPYEIKDTIQLVHKHCMGKRAEEGGNNFFRIFEERSRFSQRWRSIEWGTLIKILYFTFILGIMAIIMYLIIDKDIQLGILSALWIFLILFMLCNEYFIKVLGMSFFEKCKLTRESNIRLKLVIWKPSSIYTVV